MPKVKYYTISVFIGTCTSFPYTGVGSIMPGSVVTGPQNMRIGLIITFIKVERILSGGSKWRWDDENSDKLEKDEIFTKCAFTILLRDFRYGTPDNIIEIFKKCVLFEMSCRPSVRRVSIIFLFIRDILIYS